MGGAAARAGLWRQFHRKAAESAGGRGGGTDHEVVAQPEAFDEFPEAAAGVVGADHLAAGRLGDAEDIGGGEIGVHVRPSGRARGAGALGDDGVDHCVDPRKGANHLVIRQLVMHAAVVGQNDESAASGEGRELLQIGGGFEQGVVQRRAGAKPGLDGGLFEGAGGQLFFRGQFLLEAGAAGEEKDGDFIPGGELRERLTPRFGGGAEHAAHAAGDVEKEENLQRGGVVGKGLDRARDSLFANDEVFCEKPAKRSPVPRHQHVDADQRRGGTEDGRFFRRLGLRAEARGGEDEDQ